MKTHYRHKLMTSTNACGNRASLYTDDWTNVDCLVCSRTQVYRSAKALSPLGQELVENKIRANEMRKRLLGEDDKEYMFPSGA